MKREWQKIHKKINKRIEKAMKQENENRVESQCLPFQPCRSMQTIYVNSVDPDETARNEPSHQDLHCLPFCLSVKTETPIFNNGTVQI